MHILHCPLASPGYLYPAISVARELQRRGHAAPVMADGPHEAVVRSAGLAPLSAQQYGDPAAFRVGRWVLNGTGQYDAVCRAIRDVRADAVVTSALCHGALLAAERFDVPAFVLGFAAHLFPYQAGGDTRREAVDQREWRLREVVAHYREVREQVGMSARRDTQPQAPLIAQGTLLRGHPALEEPDATLPENIHHVGVCHWEPAADPEVVDDIRRRLARRGKPVVYVHLGRTFGGDSLWPRLNAAFTGTGLQALVERGRSGRPYPGPETDITAVRLPWMDPLVGLADVVLTSATTTPVLAAIAHHKPLVVAPAGSEQPMLAQACLRLGVAARFPDQVSAASAAVLSRVRSDHMVHRRVVGLAEQLTRLRGPAASADLITSVAAAAQPHPMRTGAAR